ncbi:outer membrane porin protein OmpD [Enterobacter sp. BIDMC87]|nr:outer membrane porin protein OmpD [Enterobacter sp. BIDMC87]
MWLMKTLLTSGCTNQRGAGHYYFNKNMSTYVDYKINLVDDSQFTKDAKVATDNIVAVGLTYQF